MEKNNSSDKSNKSDDSSADIEPNNPRDSVNLIDAANQAADRLEAGNKLLSELLEKQQKMQIEQQLGGSTSAGQAAEDKEKKAIEAAKKLIAGSGFENDVFPN
jgi:hypothetical protein